jgi:hypothetical protein
MSKGRTRRCVRRGRYCKRRDPRAARPAAGSVSRAADSGIHEQGGRRQDQREGRLAAGSVSRAAGSESRATGSESKAAGGGIREEGGQRRDQRVGRLAVGLESRATGGEERDARGGQMHDPILRDERRGGTSGWAPTTEPHLIHPTKQNGGYPQPLEMLLTKRKNWLSLTTWLGISSSPESYPPNQTAP